MKTVKTSMGLALMVLLVCALSGCGGGNTSPPPPPPPTIKITPASANVAAGGSLQFAASLMGSSNPAVTWEINGIAAGSAAVGTISSSGRYVAPVTANQVVVSAVLQSDQSTSGKA